MRLEAYARARPTRACAVSVRGWRLKAQDCTSAAAYMQSSGRPASVCMLAIHTTMCRSVDARKCHGRVALYYFYDHHHLLTVPTIYCTGGFFSNASRP